MRPVSIKNYKYPLFFSFFLPLVPNTARPNGWPDSSDFSSVSNANISSMTNCKSECNSSLHVWKNNSSLPEGEGCPSMSVVNPFSGLSTATCFELMRLVLY